MHTRHQHLFKTDLHGLRPTQLKQKVSHKWFDLMKTFFVTTEK